MQLTDSINSMPADEAVRGALVAVSALQTEPREVQVMGTAILFMTMCRSANLNTSEVLNKAERMARNGDLTRQVSALNDYVKGEIRK